MTIPKITPYTGGVANPDGSQTQTEFTQNMFDQLSYEANLSTELNNTVDGINDTAIQVDATAANAAQSAAEAEAAVSGLDYQGLWPDTGGSANKGETYQTQTGGTPTGQYFTALQNTTVDPASDNVNWREVISVATLPNYTDIVYQDINSMLIGDPITPQIGDICRAEGLEYERVSVSSPAVIGDFELKASSKVVSELPQYPHVLKYTDDNKRLRGVLEGKICSMEGETFNITEQIVINGDKTIRNNYDTIININSQIDSPIVFTGKVGCDGSGIITFNGGNNDKQDGNAAIVAFSEFMPSIDNWRFINSIGAGFLAGRLDFLTTQNGKGSGHLSNCKFESCGKGPHAYGTETNLDTRFDLINCKTDINCGTNGNILYLSGHQDAKVMYGRYEMNDACSGPNINKGVNGKYVGSTFKGGLRGPTFGKEQQYGFIGGGGNSIGSLFSAISCDLKRDADPGDGLFPVGFIEVDGWQASDCNRTMYVQGQQVHFGNIVTRRSISTDFLFRINGASPDRVFQTGSVDIFDTVDTSNVQIFNLGEQSKVKLLPSLIDHDLPKDRNIITSSVSPNEIYGQDQVNFYDGDTDPSIDMPNIIKQIQVKLATTGTTTVRLPKADFSTIYDHFTDIVCTNGNNSRVLNLSLTAGSGSLNDSSATISFRPTTSMPFIVRVYFQGSAFYKAALMSPDVDIL